MSLLFVAAIVLVVIFWRKERERRQGIQEWATQHGWQMTARPAVDWSKRMPGNGSISWLVSRTVNDRAVAVGEYSYTESGMRDSDGRRSSTTHHYVLTAVRLPVSYPSIAVEPRGLLSRIGRDLFGDNAAATGVAAFDSRFRVRTKQPGLARHLLGPILIAEHVAGRVPTWNLAGEDLLAWESGSIRDPREIPARVEVLIRVADLLGK